MYSEVTSLSCLTLQADLSPGARAEFIDAVAEMLTQSPAAIRVDCSDMTVVTSIHISALWEARMSADNASVPFQLYRPSSAVRRVLRSLDLEDAFEQINLEDSGVITTRPRQSGVARTFSDEFHPTLDDVQLSLSKFVAFLTELGLSGDVTYQLQTAYYEIAANIAIHSGLKATMTASVSARTESERIVIEFRDEGEPFDPTAAAYCSDFRAAAKRKAIRGLGIGMVHRLVDRVEYQLSKSSENVLTMIKDWRQA